MSDENAFDWQSADVVVPTQPAIAVYANVHGAVCIRQEGQLGADEDSWVFFSRDRALTIALAILDVAGVDPAALVQPASTPLAAPGLSDADRVTIADPLARIGIFQMKLAKALGSGGGQIITLAMYPSKPGYAEALAKCKAAAASIGKGWPRAWPNLELSEQGNVSPLRAA